jgi:hypothetical protein
LRRDPHIPLQWDQFETTRDPFILGLSPFTSPRGDHVCKTRNFLQLPPSFTSRLTIFSWSVLLLHSRTYILAMLLRACVLLVASIATLSKVSASSYDYCQVTRACVCVCVCVWVRECVCIAGHIVCSPVCHTRINILSLSHTHTARLSNRAWTSTTSLLRNSRKWSCNLLI